MTPEQKNLLTEVWLWKLGLQEPRDLILWKDTWQKFRNEPGFHETVDKISKSVAVELLGDLLRRQLTDSGLHSDTQAVIGSIRNLASDNRSRHETIANIIRKALKGPSGGRTGGTPQPVVPSPLQPVAAVKPLPNLPPVVAARQTPYTNLPPVTAAKPTMQPTPNPPKPANQTPAPPIPKPIAQTPPPVAAQQPAVPQPLSLAGWVHKPVPPDEPEPHTEFDARGGQSSEAYEILGARVRGKKHKHDGTHCDDWFTFANCGPWTILVVSDGGGSYKFSRIGAKAACEAVIESLTVSLKDHVLKPRTMWEAASFQEPDVEHVRDSLTSAMIAAWDAVQSAVKQRESDPAYEKALGRPLTTKDLYCTLLVTVHTTVRHNDLDRSLVFGLAIGDGMMAAVDVGGNTRLLMTPDSGEHSGEVRFLDQREVDPVKLRNKIFPLICNLRALLLMTDGVADDYFPNDPGMTWLYGDLVLNGILPVPTGTDSDLKNALSGTTVTSEADLAAVNCVHEIELPNPDQSMRKERVLSLASLAEKLGLPAEEVVRRISLIGAVRRKGDAAEPTAPEALLEKWLDSYHVRGSFDDRTLIVMHRQELP